MFLAQPFCRRRERTVGWRRIDCSWNRRMMPEDPDPELCGVIVIGDTEIVSGVQRVGIPPRGNYGCYAQARMTDLWNSLASEDGPHARSSEGWAYAEFETRVILGRYQYLQAVEHYLMDVRQPPVEHGAVWRYLCLVVSNTWLRRDIHSVSFGREPGTLSSTP